MTKLKITNKGYSTVAFQSDFFKGPLKIGETDIEIPKKNVHDFREVCRKRHPNLIITENKKPAAPAPAQTKPAPAQKEKECKKEAAEGGKNK